MLSGARKKLFKSEPADLVSVANWTDTTGTGRLPWWTALEHNFVLESTEDEYGGVVVDADTLPVDKDAFATSLAASLSYWKSVVRTRNPHSSLNRPCIFSSSLVVQFTRHSRRWLI